MSDYFSKTNTMNIEFLRELSMLNGRYSEMINHNSVEIFSQKTNVEDLFNCFMDLNKLKYWSTLEREINYETESDSQSQLLSQKRDYSKNDSLKSQTDFNKDLSTLNSDSQNRNRHFKFITKQDSSHKSNLKKISLARKPKSGEHRLKLKMRSDCIRKRIKSMLNNFVINTLNSFLVSINSNTELMNLPKDFNIDIRIESSQQMLESTVREVFTTFPSNQVYYSRVSHNKNLIESCENPKFQEMISKKFKDFYVEYLKSDKLLKDLNVLSQKEGNSYVENFKKYLETFLSYFGVN